MLALLSSQAVMRCYPDVKKAIGGSEKIFEYLDRNPQRPPVGTRDPQGVEGRVEFKNVTFTYPGKQIPVLMVLCYFTTLSPHLCVCLSECLFGCPCSRTNSQNYFQCRFVYQ